MENTFYEIDIGNKVILQYHSFYGLQSFYDFLSFAGAIDPSIFTFYVQNIS